MRRREKTDFRATLLTEGQTYYMVNQRAMLQFRHLIDFQPCQGEIERGGEIDRDREREGEI